VEFIQRALCEVPESILKEKTTLMGEIESKIALVDTRDGNKTILSLFKVGDELEYFVQAFTKRLRILQTHNSTASQICSPEEESQKCSGGISGLQTQRCSFAQSVLTPHSLSALKRDNPLSKIKDYSQKKMISPSKHIFNHAIAATRIPLTTRKVGNMRVSK
jgi:hypothetical protein